MEGYLEEGDEILQRIRDWTRYACKCHLKTNMNTNITSRCSCWDSKQVFIRLNRSQCQFLTLHLEEQIRSICRNPPNATNAALELRRILRTAELLVEECRCTQWLLKALELTVGEEYFLDILRDSKDELDGAWPGGPSNTGQKFLQEYDRLSVEAREKNKFDRDELERQLEKLMAEPSNRDITTPGDLARFVKTKFFDTQPSSETQDWTPPELSKFRTNINTLEIYPKGASAQVRDLKLLGKAYVVKIPIPSSVPSVESDPGRCAFKKEAELLAKYRYPHLVRCIGFWNVESKPFIVEEKMDLDLQKLIDKMKGAGLQLRALEVIELVLPVAKVMRYLHDREVAHRDLKPGNIMCSLEQKNSLFCSPLQDINIKLIDLGEAEVKNVTCFSSRHVVGTRDYIAPEIKSGTHLDLLKADVFSFGVLLLKVSTGLTVRGTWVNVGALHENDRTQYKDRLEAGERPPISAGITPECLRSVIKRCWAPDPQQRPSFDRICRDLINARLELSTEKHGRWKRFKTWWLDVVRNAHMHTCLQHSRLHLMRALARSLPARVLALLLCIAVLFCIWSYFQPTVPHQQRARAVLPKCMDRGMDLRNQFCVAALDSLVASQG